MSSTNVKQRHSKLSNCPPSKGVPQEALAQKVSQKSVPQECLQTVLCNSAFGLNLRPFVTPVIPQEAMNSLLLS